MSRATLEVEPILELARHLKPLAQLHTEIKRAMGEHADDRVALNLALARAFRGIEAPDADADHIAEMLERLKGAFLHANQAINFTVLDAPAAGSERGR